MHKNKLQELAQRRGLNLPSYSCVRQGPDHGPRFRATVSFNGESFESPHFYSSLRQAEHAAAEVAIQVLSNTTGPNQSLTTQILDETGVCKNILQETAQKAGIKLPVYTVERKGPGHLPAFVSTVELAGMAFSGEPAKSKKQAEKNAAMVAWASLKQLVQGDKSLKEDLSDANEEQLQKLIARALLNAQKDSEAQRSQPAPQPQPEPPSQSPAGSPRKETKQRVRIIPMPQNSERGPCPSTSCLHENKGSSYGYALDRQNVTSSEKSATVSRWIVNQPGGVMGQIPLQIHGMPIVIGPESQVTLFSTNQMQHDYEQNNWFQAGPPTVMLVNNPNELNVSDTGFPFVQAYNQMVLTPGNHHWIGMQTPTPQVNPHPPAAKPASSLAPRVRIRRAVPVCSAPPPSLPEEHVTETDELASLQALQL